MIDRVRRTRTEIADVFARNPLLRLLAVNALVGAAVSVVLLAGLILTDSHGIGRLILGSEGGWLGAALLLFGFLVTFPSVAMGVALMSLKSDDDEDDDGDGAPVLRPVPVPVRGARGRYGKPRSNGIGTIPFDRGNLL